MSKLDLASGMLRTSRFARGGPQAGEGRIPAEEIK